VIIAAFLPHTDAGPLHAAGATLMTVIMRFLTNLFLRRGDFDFGQQDQAPADACTPVTVGSVILKTHRTNIR